MPRTSSRRASPPPCETIRADDREIALKAWLYTIVRNRSLNSLRDEPVHEEIDPQHDGVPQPPDVAARRAEVASLVVGLKGLPEQQREAIVQRELSGLGHEQIAGNLGVTSGAVRQLIFRARTNLREGFGLLIPVPVLRQLLESAAVRSTGADAAIAGSGGAVAVKLGIALLAAGAAVGGGTAALEHRGHPAIPEAVSPAIADASPAPHRHHAPSGAPARAAGESGPARSARTADRPQDGRSEQPADASGSGPSSGNPGPSSPSGSSHGPSHSGGDDTSGHSGSSDSGSDHGDDGGSDSSGHGSGGGDHSGPSHSGGDGGPSVGDDGSSSGDDGETTGDDDPVEVEEPAEDHSGPGPGHGEGPGSGDELDD